MNRKADSPFEKSAGIVDFSYYTLLAFLLGLSGLSDETEIRQRRHVDLRLRARRASGGQGGLRPFSFAPLHPVRVFDP